MHLFTEVSNDPPWWATYGFLKASGQRTLRASIWTTLLGKAHTRTKCALGSGSFLLHLRTWRHWLCCLSGHQSSLGSSLAPGCKHASASLILKAVPGGLLAPLPLQLLPQSLVRACVLRKWFTTELQLQSFLPCPVPSRAGRGGAGRGGAGRGGAGRGGAGREDVWRAGAGECWGLDSLNPEAHLVTFCCFLLLCLHIKVIFWVTGSGLQGWSPFTPGYTLDLKSSLSPHSPLPGNPHGTWTFQCLPTSLQTAFSVSPTNNCRQDAPASPSPVIFSTDLFIIWYSNNTYSINLSLLNWVRRLWVQAFFLSGLQTPQLFTQYTHTTLLACGFPFTLQASSAAAHRFCFDSDTLSPGDSGVRSMNHKYYTWKPFSLSSWKPGCLWALSADSLRQQAEDGRPIPESRGLF
jgi:hypothetical protein